MLQESEIIPYHCSPPVGEKILVLAPHPDDETLGCGGTISLLVKAKKQVKVVFLTSGDKADPSHKLSKKIYRVNLPTPPLPQGSEKGLLNSHFTEYALLREKEAVKALKILGVGGYEFLRFPDRELDAFSQDALHRLVQILREYVPDAIYSPSPLELNPDHRATAALAVAMHRTMAQSGMAGHLIFYEVTVPLRPNLLVDVSDSYGRKKKAMKKYESQLRLNNYLHYITAVNIFRTLTVKGTKYIEAFWSLQTPLNNEEIARWLSYSELGHTSA
ncbi:MAG: PIG-L deacetylase family protein [Thermodesulfovibrionales bacterium]|nr:PIG-L deacetylase family protein [Thermodesulfovibrionales bacterium]